MNYKHLFLFQFLWIVCLGGCTSKQQEGKENTNIAGSWEWKNNSDAHTFDLLIELKGKKLKGAYCAVYDYGNQIDCADDKEYNVAGQWVKDHWQVEYTSPYSGEKGHARLQYNEAANTLHWKNETPEVSSFCPETAVMVKQ